MLSALHTLGHRLVLLLALDLATEKGCELLEVWERMDLRL